MDMNIENTLRERFSAPLPDGHTRRIVFWHDPDGEFSSAVDELRLDGVKLLKLTGTNDFAAKRLLSTDDTQSDYLVYDPRTIADVREDWLLDIELYSEEFRADLWSIRMQELGIPGTAAMRKTLKAYGKFFENRERVAKLAALHTDYTDAGQLHIDILSVLAGAAVNSAAGIIRAVLIAGLDPAENTAIANIRRFGDEAALWALIGRYTGYAPGDDASLLPLAAHILLTALSVTMQPACLRGLEQFISPPHQQFCYSLIHEWMHSAQDDDLYEIARAVEEQLRLAERFDALDVAELLGSECFPCINECILRRYMTEIADDVIKADDIVATVEKRRTLKWYKRVQYDYDGLLQVALMQQFYRAHIDGFHIAEYPRLWEAYTGGLYQMDSYYRRFHTAFGRSLKNSCTVLTDLYKNVADYAEKLYKNWFLAELGGRWTSLIRDELKSGAALPALPQQTEFYRRFVRPTVSAGSRVYVIVSDALRYEVAAELTDRLLQETKGTAKLSAMQAVFPSVTRFGMAALLPHTDLQLTEDLRVLCDGMPTDGTAAREKVLAAAHEGNAAIGYRTLLSMKQAERRERVSGADVVYIYHDTIDAAGDKPATEDQVFEACAQAVAELKNLVRLIVNDLSGAHILITADHGFLYSYRPLAESDKAEKDLVDGQILELGRRYAIAREDRPAGPLLRIPLTQLQSPWTGFAPGEAVRFKKPGGGMNYVHGGISLQECAVPVITFQNLRSTSKKFVDVQKAGLRLISQSRKVSNSIFSLDLYQPEPVGGKIAAATYEVYMADASGAAVSDRQTVIADKTAANGTARVFRVRLTLKSMAFPKTDTYYLTVAEKGAAGTAEKTEFSIDIAFANEFDF